MRLPKQARAVVRGINVGRVDERLHPSGCSVFKKIACGAAIAACGAVCYVSLGTACVECLAGIGGSDCIDCF